MSPGGREQMRGGRMQRRFHERIVWRKQTRGQALFTEYISPTTDGGQGERNNHYLLETEELG